MAFSIRNARVEEKARAYAAQTGTTLTGALELALDKAMPPKKSKKDMTFEEWIAPIRKVQEEVARLPDTGCTEQDIMGWDENGLPT